MKRRTLSAIGIIAVLMIVGGVTWYFIDRANRQREEINIALGEAMKAMQGSVSTKPNTPKLHWEAKLDGDTTVLTLRITNENDVLIKNLVLDGFQLDKVDAREKATFPITVPELAKGASHEIVLHYDKLTWLGDDVRLERLDLLWAEKPFDIKMNWVVSTTTEKTAEHPRVTSVRVNSTSEQKSEYKGIRVTLDPEQAKLLKKKRDDALKARDKTKPEA